MKPELRTRLITAGVLIVGLCLILLLVSILNFPNNSLLLASIALLLSLAAAWEFASFSEPKFQVRLRVMLLVGCPLIASGLIAFTLQNALSAFLLATFLSLTFLFWYCVVLARNDLPRFSHLMATDGVAQLLIGVGGAALIGISFTPECLRLVIYLVSLVAVNDSAAYFVGSRVGGPKLAPAISPKKTLSGSLAGLLVGIAYGVCFGSIFNLGSVTQMITLSGLLVVSAQVGDLVKSYLKRLYGVKDSGKILPGHGGILDRIDGILGSAPLCLVWVELFR